MEEQMKAGYCDTSLCPAQFPGAWFVIMQLERIRTIIWEKPLERDSPVQLSIVSLSYSSMLGFGLAFIVMCSVLSA